MKLRAEAHSSVILTTKVIENLPVIVLELIYV
jgi:hypothetical protein